MVLTQVRDLKVSSIQPVDTVLCKDQTAAAATVEDLPEQILMEHFYFECLLLDQMKNCEICK